jgi:hypothetical protein
VGANLLVVALWAVLATSGQLDLVKISLWPGQPPLPAGFFWPIFPIAICAVHCWFSWRRAYPRHGYPDGEIERELARVTTAGVPDPALRTPSTRPAATSSTSTGEAGPVVRRSAEESAAARRRGFAVHVLVYLVVSAVLTVTWWFGGGGFFWPVFLMAAWGVGVLINGYLVYRPGSGDAGND